MQYFCFLWYILGYYIILETVAKFYLEKIHVGLLGKFCQEVHLQRNYVRIRITYQTSLVNWSLTPPLLLNSWNHPSLCYIPARVGWFLLYYFANLMVCLRAAAQGRQSGENSLYNQHPTQWNNRLFRRFISQNNSWKLPVSRETVDNNSVYNRHNFTSNLVN